MLAEFSILKLGFYCLLLNIGLSCFFLSFFQQPSQAIVVSHGRQFSVSRQWVSNIDGAAAAWRGRVVQRSVCALAFQGYDHECRSAGPYALHLSFDRRPARVELREESYTKAHAQLVLGQAWNNTNTCLPTPLRNQIRSSSQSISIRYRCEQKK